VHQRNRHPTSSVAWRGGPAQACHSSEWGGSPLGHLIERVAGGVQLSYLREGRAELQSGEERRMQDGGLTSIVPVAATTVRKKRGGIGAAAGDAHQGGRGVHRLPQLTRMWPPWEQEVGEGEDGRGAMGGGAGGAPMASAAGGDVGGEAGRYGCSLIASAREKKSRGVAPREKGASGQSWGGSGFCSGAVWKKPTERGR
jgi:hypothetical protein